MHANTLKKLYAILLRKTDSKIQLIIQLRRKVERT